MFGNLCAAFGQISCPCERNEPVSQDTFPDDVHDHLGAFSAFKCPDSGKAKVKEITRMERIVDHTSFRSRPVSKDRAADLMHAANNAWLSRPQNLEKSSEPENEHHSILIRMFHQNVIGMEAFRLTGAISGCRRHRNRTAKEIIAVVRKRVAVISVF